MLRFGQMAVCLRHHLKFVFLQPSDLGEMKALIPALQAALDNPVCYGPFEPDWDALIPPVQIAPMLRFGHRHARKKI